MPTLTRRRYPERPDCWHVYYGDVHAGTIARRVGNRSADPDGIAKTEADHFGKCPGCGEWFDMHGPDEVMVHVPHITPESAHRPLK